MSILSNDGYIILNKYVMKALGLHEAILLGELCSEYIYWYKEEKLQDGFFYSTRENIEKETKEALMLAKKEADEAKAVKDAAIERAKQAKEDEIIALAAAKEAEKAEKEAAKKAEEARIACIKIDENAKKKLAELKKMEEKQGE